jgi:diguanylate cyclase (GGDEF)-like protein
MKTTLQERLRRQIEECLDEPERRPDVVQALVQKLEETYRSVDGTTPAEEPAELNTLSMLKAALDATADGILVLDPDGNYVTSNRIFHDMWRIPRGLLRRGQERAVAKFAMSQVKDPEAVLQKAVELHRSSQARSIDVVQFHDGRYFECVSMPQLVAGRSVGRVWSFRDVTDRVRAEQRIRHNAYHDSLTQLPNRALFQDRLTQEVGRARRAGSNTAVLLLDVDRFKTINDTLGHAAGDMLLVEVAKRLKSRKREGDTIARLGGDEFVLIVSDLRHKEDAALVAEQLLEVLKPPIQIAEHDLHVSASIGIAIFPDDGDGGASLLKSADMALYRAKELGRDNYQVFEPKLNQRVMERLVLEKDLRRAIHEREFIVHYQPQYDLQTGKMRGVEALVRWKQGVEVVSPGRFIPIAEECGLIVPLGSWVLKEATRRCALFNRHSPEPLRICVNVSALQIQRPDFANEVTQVLQEAGLSPEHLVIELTESALMHNPEQGSYAMEQLQRMGVGIAMDDFGTGHSSLNYISVLPISLIKIDRSFVVNCAKRKADESILTAIVTMGHALGLTVLAEGVETEEQARILRDQGCDEVQGYLYSRPVPPERLIDMLKGK